MYRVELGVLPVEGKSVPCLGAHTCTEPPTMMDLLEAMQTLRTSGAHSYAASAVKCAVRDQKKSTSWIMTMGYIDNKCTAYSMGSTIDCNRPNSRCCTQCPFLTAHSVV